MFPSLTVLGPSLEDEPRGQPDCAHVSVGTFEHFVVTLKKSKLLAAQGKSQLLKTSSTVIISNTCAGLATIIRLAEILVNLQSPCWLKEGLL